MLRSNVIQYGFHRTIQKPSLDIYYWLNQLNTVSFKQSTPANEAIYNLPMPPRSKIPCTRTATPLRPAPETEAPARPKKIPRTPERRAEEIPPTPPPSPQPCSPAEKIPESRPESSMFQGPSSLAALQKRFKKDCQQAGVVPIIPPGSAGGTSSGTARTGDTRCEERPQEAIEYAEETCKASASHSWRLGILGMHCNKCDSWTWAMDAVLYGHFEENEMFTCAKCLPTPHLDPDIERKEKERCS